LGFRDQAYAYLDFNVGGYLLQMAVAAVAGATVFLRNYWKRLIGMVRKLLGDAGTGGKQRPVPDQNEPSN
jgi:hypothetical protein